MTFLFLRKDNRLLQKDDRLLRKDDRLLQKDNRLLQKDNRLLQKDDRLSLSLEPYKEEGEIELCHKDVENNERSKMLYAL